MAAETIILPKWHFKKRVKHQYSNVALAIAREILQNSQDAGATVVKFELGKNSYKATDDGKGMTLDEFRQFYLTLGGTKKDTGSIGGFGTAKELLSFAWENWQCKGQGFVVNGSGADQPESDESDGIARGFEVSASDNDLPADNITGSLEYLTALSNLTIKVKINGESLDTKGRKLRRNQLLREYEFGKLYVHKGRCQEYENPGRLYIRTRGLYTTSEHIGGDYVYYLELDAASPDVLTENRDGLRWEIKNQIQQTLQAVSRNPDSIEKRPQNPQIKVYGSLDAGSNGSSIYQSEYGYFDLATGPGLWRKPFAIADDGRTKLTTKSGNFRPTMAKALTIWDTTLALVSASAELERPIPGICRNIAANGVSFTIADRQVICATTDAILSDTPFGVLELAIHEFAHYVRSSHSQEYELERMRIARQIGASAPAILDTIRRLQAEPTRRKV